LSIENLYARNTGSRLSCNAIKRLTQEQIQQQFDDPNVALAIDSNHSLMNALEQQINVLEQAILKQAKLKSLIKADLQFILIMAREIAMRISRLL